MNTVHWHQKFLHIENFPNQETVSRKISEAIQQLKLNHEVYSPHTEHITKWPADTEMKGTHTNVIPSWPEVNRIHQKDEHPMTMEEVETGTNARHMTNEETAAFTTRD